MSKQSIFLWLGVAMFASCGSDAASSTPQTASSATSTTAVTSTTAATAATTTATGATTTAADASTTTTPSTTTIASAITAAATTTTSPESRVTKGIPTDDEEFTTTDLAIPTGDLVVGPADLIVLSEDGDLWLHPGAIGDDATEPVLIVDNADPRPEVDAGPGPNVVETVAGVVGGALFYSDCCEPIVGNLLAATQAGTDPVHFGYGYRPELSPDRTRLATANSHAIAVIDLVAATSIALPVNNGSEYVELWDASWTADGATLIVLYADDGFALQPFAVGATLVAGTPVSIGVPFDTVSAFDTLFAGHGPAGEIALSVRSATATTIRFFDGATLVERPELQLTLPASVTSVQLGADGRSLLWVDGGVLWYSADGGEALQLGTGYLAAWFAF